ncbi:MAG TPA: hypothetical protein VGM19_08060 [Armatimonadota bacterium]|jgi:hypothetical protein
MRITILTLLALLCGLPVGANSPVDTHNLLRNGDFEEGGAPPPGWTPASGSGAAYQTTPQAFTGLRALQVSFPQPSNASLLSDPAPVEAGQYYLLTFWYRAEGMSTKGGTYDGCTSVVYLLWSDASGKQIGQSGYSLPYGPVADFTPGTYLASAPPGATTVRCRLDSSVSADYHGPATAIYYDVIRLVKVAPAVTPPSPRRWTYTSRQPGSGVELVDDPEALQGKAALAQAGKVAKWVALTWGEYTPDQPIGDYLVTFRLKVKDNSATTPVASLSIDDLGGLSGQIMDPKVLLASDFKEPGVYQDFTIRFLRPESGVMSFIVSYQGGTDLWYDKVTVTQLATFTTDKEQAAIWLGE